MNAAALSRIAKRADQKRRLHGAALNWREDQVLRSAALGMTNGEIGKALHLSEDTVKTYMRRVFDKLGTDNRVEAVLIGIEQGILACPCVRRSPKVTHLAECPAVLVACGCRAVAS